MEFDLALELTTVEEESFSVCVFLLCGRRDRDYIRKLAILSRFDLSNLR